MLSLPLTNTQQADEFAFDTPAQDKVIKFTFDALSRQPGQLEQH